METILESMGEQEKRLLNMPKQEPVCRTIHQYSKGPVSGEDMEKLLEIAEDYRKVKNYVYARYGGIRSLSKLYPGYTIQNEMTDCGLRAELMMPSVYYYRAVFDALGDIKCGWARTKGGLLKLIGRNENLTEEEKHYLRFVMKSNNAFEAVLNRKPIRLPQEMQAKYDEIAGQTDVEKMHRYLCRQVRKYHVRNLHTDAARGFFITERAYRYGEMEYNHSADSHRKQHGIYVASKEKRKRIFIPLTDENTYKQQIYIKLKPEENEIQIDIPIEMKTRTHRDYTKEIGLSQGIWNMFTTHEGTVYGERFGILHQELAEYMRTAARTYNREKNNNAGRKKYKARKAKLDAALETYVNQEINRMLAEEKPQTIYLPALPKSGSAGYRKEINYSAGVWRRGLIRERLEQKCRENSVEIVAVFGKAISTECSECGGTGKYSRDMFRCDNCGYEADKKKNAAKNAIKRGRTEFACQK